LSEGEQQLLTVLGLLKFTGGKDSLFLLDEPDTHLNPAWTVKYLEFLRTFVPNEDTSHVLMVSHHPLSIAELHKEQVQVMWRDDNFQVHAQEPYKSPRGMGFSGILTSDMFGLNSTLDRPTEDLLRERRALIEQETLTDADKEKLKTLNQTIEKLGMSTTHWDAEFEEFLRIKNEQDAVILQEGQVNPETIRARRNRAKEIIEGLEKSRESNEN